MARKTNQTTTCDAKIAELEALQSIIDRRTEIENEVIALISECKFEEAMQLLDTISELSDEETEESGIIIRDVTLEKFDPFVVCLSIWLSDELLHYIESYEGEGFNQKFENIILDAMKSEADRQQRLAFLDQQIVDREKKIHEMITQYDEFNRNICSLLDSFSRATFKRPL